ncbi:MAG TPA: hypothetical protein PLN52_08590 [Opitutaceae bacterium]|nr:hypothetical protein [Opitutaceae bacterium]
MIQTVLEKDAALSTLAHVCRRICVLRARGRSVEANQLQSSEFARALIDLKAQHGADAFRDDEVRALFQKEQERVADAMVLAELLTHWMPPHASPAMRASTSEESATRPPPAEVKPRVDSPLSPVSPTQIRYDETASPQAAPNPAVKAPAVSSPTSPPAIADLLDDMLNQDAARQRRTRGR